MKFTFDESQTRDNVFVMKITTDQHNDVAVWFADHKETTIDIDDVEIDALSDSLYGMFVSINGEFKCLHDIVRQAVMKFDDYLNEYMSDCAIEEQYAEDTASLRMSGRV